MRTLFWLGLALCATACGHGAQCGSDVPYDEEIIVTQEEYDEALGGDSELSADACIALCEGSFQNGSVETCEDMGDLTIHCAGTEEIGCD